MSLGTSCRFVLPSRAKFGVKCHGRRPVTEKRFFPPFRSDMSNSCCAGILYFPLFCGNGRRVFSFAASLAQEASPDAGQLLKRVRQGATLQENKDIKGQIRKRSVKIPFSMSLRGNLIAFQYQLNNVWNRFDLKFKDRGQEILSWKDGKAGVLPVAQYAVPIAGTDVTYEDLSMRYLYWPQAKLSGMMRRAPSRGGIAGLSRYRILIPGWGNMPGCASGLIRRTAPCGRWMALTAAGSWLKGS